MRTRARLSGLYDQALQLNPSDAQAFYGRGAAYWQQGDFESQSEATPAFSLTSAQVCHQAKIVKSLPFVFLHLQTFHVTTSLSFVIQSDSDRIYRRGRVAVPNHPIALATSMRSLDEICFIV